MVTATHPLVYIGEFSYTPAPKPGETPSYQRPRVFNVLASPEFASEWFSRLNEPLTKEQKQQFIQRVQNVFTKNVTKPGITSNCATIQLKNPRETDLVSVRVQPQTLLPPSRLIDIACCDGTTTAIRAFYSAQDPVINEKYYETMYDTVKNQIKEAINKSTSSDEEKIVAQNIFNNLFKEKSDTHEKTYQEFAKKAASLFNPKISPCIFLPLSRIREVVLIAIAFNPKKFQYASQRLQDDELVAARAVSSDAAMFKFVSTRLQGDKTFLLTTIPCNPDILLCVSPKTLQDEILLALKHSKKQEKTTNNSTPPRL